ncbi:MAG: F0F1 ATP synthase subunit A [Bryobacteraceae bacterium]
MEHELGITKFFNDNLAGLGNTFLSLVGQHAHNPERPWANSITVQILVAVVMMAIFAILKPQISMDRPGKLQHLFEVIYGFLHDQAEEVIGHHGTKFLHLFATLFFFILFCNLIGLIPAFESPTMFPEVPLGCALLTFIYYNFQGFSAQGVVHYLKHFAGPVWWLAPIMIPIEIVSHLARPMSLTIRLFANMFAGEQVTLAFMKMVPLFIPVVFMGLHLFVSFLQAYIFALMTMIYVSSAVAHEEH